MDKELFKYLKVNTIDFEEKIQKVWNYYKKDIECWVNNFKNFYNKYYNDGDFKKDKIDIVLKNKDDKTNNKNIEKMKLLYEKKLLDPFNMFLFINSVIEEQRIKVFNTMEKNCIFLGVPSYKQSPALINEFNKKFEELKKSDKLEENIKKELNPKSLYDLINFAEEIKKINNISEIETIKNFEYWWKKFANSLAKFTSALFYLNPYNFIPLNKYTIDLFKFSNEEKININKLNSEKYLNLCKQIKKKEKKLQIQIKNIMLFPLLSAYSFYNKNIIAEILESYKNTKNIILTGAPGVGKTYSIKKYLQEKLGKEYEKRVEFMQFHPGIEYEDFIEGIKPVGIYEGNIKLKLINGTFKNFCKKALENPEKEYYFVIDEINRANVSAVFGELLNTIEYRIKIENKKPKNPQNLIKTQYGELINNLPENEKKELSLFEEYPGKFGVPENIYILGTMNDIDRSIENFDLAFRRRFVWVNMEFDENVIRFEVEKPEKLIKRAKNLNKEIEKLMNSKNYIIGHSYFLKINNYNSYKTLWDYHIKPLLKEFLRAEFDENELKEKLECLEKIFVHDKDEKCQK